MIVTPAEMRAVEEAVFAGGVTAEALLDAVGRRIAEYVEDALPTMCSPVLVYAGKGNNAGDALVAAADLGKRRFCDVLLRLARRSDPGELAGKKLGALPPDDFPRYTAEQARAIRLRIGGRLIIIDGLLGIGAKGELRDPIKSAAREINELRRTRGAYVIAIDTPTGLDAETGAADPDAVIADETLTVGFPKTGLLADPASELRRQVARHRVARVFRRGQTGPRRCGAGHVHHSLVPRRLVAAASARIQQGYVRSRGHPRRFGRRDGCGGDVLARLRAGGRGIDHAARAPGHLSRRGRGGLAGSDGQAARFTDGRAGHGFRRARARARAGQTGGDNVRALIERWPKPMVVDADGLNALSEDIRPCSDARPVRGC